METEKDIIKEMISKANSDNIKDVEEDLNYICKKIKSKDLKLICLDKNYNFNLYKIYSKKQNYSNQKIASLLPDLLSKISVLKDENIFTSFNGCGGCLMTTIFLIAGNNPSLETKFYNYIINYLGDFDGIIFEKKAFMIMAKRIMDDLKDSDDEICERFNNNIWKDYVQATGVLFSSNDFVEKSKEDSYEVNKFVEDYIKKHDGFNKEKAKEIINLLVK